MPTARDYTEPFLSTYVPPSGAADGVCNICHGPALSKDGRAWNRCYSCRESVRVPHPTHLVVPISLVHKSESQLYDVLYGYKGVHATHEQRLQVAAILLRFLTAHRMCITSAAGVDWDTITVVPSTRGRDVHPLEEAIGLAPELHRELAALLAAGPGMIGRRAPAHDGYLPAAEANGRHVLLIDDTFTTGSHLQSAASALVVGGATVVGAVVIGRLVDTAWEVKRAVWDERRREPFSFEACCLE